MTHPSLELTQPLTDNPAESFTLSRAYYLDAEIFEKEKTHIFYRTWQYVTPVAALPNIGDYQAFEICDEQIFVIRSGDGQLRGFYNVCRHRAHELVSGKGNKPHGIVCPYHAWSYRNDGPLMVAPKSEGRASFSKQDFSLKEVRLEVFCGCIFVNLDDEAISLAELAGDLQEDILSYVPNLDSFGVLGSNLLGETYADAGWKVVVDNFAECYHCGPAHPDFASLIDMDDYQVDVFDQWSRQLGPTIRNENSAYPVAKSEEMQGSAFWFLWPNTTFNIMPGSLELAVYAIRPVDLTSSRFEGEILTNGASSSQARVDYTADVLSIEDINLCESVQRGLNSKSYQQGPIMVDDELSGTGEQALHHFHRLVHRALTDDSD